MGLGHVAVVEPTSSNDFRNVILSQHEALRELLTEAVDLTSPMARAGTELDTLRAHARGLFLTLEEHLSFEERAFPQALRDVIGWGGVLQAQIEDNHARQREALATALLTIERATLSWPELAKNVRMFATTLLHDIEEEDAALLNADLDAIATDSEGG